MLNLDILCKKYASISPLQLKIHPESNLERNQDVCCFYAEKLHTEKGQASHLITDEFLFVGKIIQRETGAILLVGPATEYILSLEAKIRIASKLGLRGKSAVLLKKQLEEIPIMKLTQFLQ